MKFALALAFVSFPILTFAKPQYVLRNIHTVLGDTYNHGCRGRDDQDPQVSTTTTDTLLGEVTVTTTTTTLIGIGVLPARAEPTGPGTKREVSARDGGWVQKPSGTASFTAYGGCQAACE
jgi:hypothetical protein